MDNFDFDFSGWATKNDVKCSDGRTIMKDAFKHNDGARVPLVYNHMHNDITAILGHAYLENRNEGVYAYCKFNDTESGQNAKLLVEHGDVDSLSIYANKLKQHGSCVIHGDIRELSLVLAGANPEAHIDNILAHGEYHEDEAIFCFDEPLDMYHSEDAKKTEDKESDDSGETVKDVFDTLTEKQKKAVYAVVGMALQDGNDDEDEDSEGGKDEMKHNVFETDEKQGNTLSHSEMMAIVDDAKRTGSLKEAKGRENCSASGTSQFRRKKRAFGQGHQFFTLSPTIRRLEGILAMFVIIPKIDTEVKAVIGLAVTVDENTLPKGFYNSFVVFQKGF